MSAVGVLYEEDGAVHLTARLGDYVPSHTRRFSSYSELYTELLTLRSIPQDEMLDLASRLGEHIELPGDTREWARILLRGSTFPVRFMVFYEIQGPVLTYCLAGSFMPATFSNKNGASFENAGQLVDVLNSVGLPGKKIARLGGNPEIFLVTAAQLRLLRLRPLETTQ
ncbi:MAG TPA: hypothetical protein VG759_21915 [Candidatus Angelobacter sp.]|jgi:hypothetical protein|nr:hypothetical protein [Candidatus Angelobacter sp.]